MMLFHFSTWYKLSVGSRAIDCALVRPLVRVHLRNQLRDYPPREHWIHLLICIIGASGSLLGRGKPPALALPARSGSFPDEVPDAPIIAQLPTEEAFIKRH